MFAKPQKKKKKERKKKPEHVCGEVRPETSVL
jgi:hypothetical protein